jgi:Spy/CpxP family protein refolding chaperone
MNGKILRNALIAGVLLVCATPALIRAQGSGGSQDSGQTQTTPTQSSGAGPNLNLTDDQKEQIKQIREQIQAEIKAIQDNSSLSAQQKEEQMKQVREDARKQEAALLTPQQKQILEQWRASHHSSGSSHK